MSLRSPRSIRDSRDLAPAEPVGNQDRCSRRPRVWEAEADIARSPFRKSGRKYGDLDIVVVVNLGGLLAGICAQDASGVLDKPSLKRDRSGKEQRVQCGAIESLADEMARSPDHTRRAAVGRSESLHSGGTLAGAHPALEDDWI